MGHPSDWDEIRALLSQAGFDFQANALGLQPCDDWHANVQQLAQSIDGRSIVVGYSLGARLSLGLALEFPKKVAGLMFISGNPGLQSASQRDQRWQADQRLAKQLQTQSLEIFLENWYRQSVFASIPPEILEAEVQRKMLRADPAWPAILRGASVAKQPNYWPRLNELSMPTLVIAGENDEKYRDFAVQIGNKCANPNLKTEIVADCGHMVHRQATEVLVRLIGEFISSNASDADLG